MQNTETQVSENAVTKIRPRDIYDQLCKKVSVSDARLRLNTAMVSCGLKDSTDDVFLKMNDAKTLCLELIRQGGPAFHVGQNLYRQHLQ